MYKVITTLPNEALTARWNAFLANARFATNYVTPNYFIDPYVRGERFVVLALDGDEIQAVLSGIRNGDQVTSGMFSRPQMAFREGTDRKKATRALLDALFEIGGRRSLIEIHAWEPMPDFAQMGMSARPSTDATSIVVLDLTVGRDALFAGFSQTRRNEIRKAQKQNVVEIKQIETDEELVELYDIYRDWNLRKGHQPDSIELMRTAVEQTESRRVFIAKVQEKVIAGSFYRFCPGGVVEYAANFSLPEYQRLRPNDLIGWQSIEWACRENFKLFSMGGAHLFLRRFGGDIITTYRYRLDQTRFRLHDLRENARELGTLAYRRLPENVKNSVRLMRSR